MHDATAATPAPEASASPAPPAPPTAAVADAALRLGVDARLAPVALRAVPPCAPLAGCRAPAYAHLGSVDVLLETIDDAAPGDVLVIYNGGRLDEACIGDLMVLEAERAGLAAMIVWGCTATRRSCARSACPCSASARAPTARGASRPPGVACAPRSSTGSP